MLVLDELASRNAGAHLQAAARGGAMWHEAAPHATSSGSAPAPAATSAGGDRQVGQAAAFCRPPRAPALVLRPISAIGRALHVWRRPRSLQSSLQPAAVHAAGRPRPAMKRIRVALLLLALLAGARGRRATGSGRVSRLAAAASPLKSQRAALIAPRPTPKRPACRRGGRQAAGARRWAAPADGARRCARRRAGAGERPGSGRAGDLPLRALPAARPPRL